MAGAHVQRRAVSTRERSHRLVVRGEQGHDQLLRDQSPAGIVDLGEVEAPVLEGQRDRQADDLGQVPEVVFSDLLTGLVELIHPHGSIDSANSAEPGVDVAGPVLDETGGIESVSSDMLSCAWRPPCSESWLPVADRVHSLVEKAPGWDLGAEPCRPST